LYFFFPKNILELKLSLDQSSRENEELRMENDKLREKSAELENWIMMLLNNFY